MPIKFKLPKINKHIRTTIYIKNKLLNDLIVIGCPIDFIFDIRGYSKKHFARYDPNKTKVILYPYEDYEKTKLYSYEIILEHTIHEVCHHIQWSDPKFIRFKGVMHNSEFYRIFDEYWGRAKKK